MNVKYLGYAISTLVLSLSAHASGGKKPEPPKPQPPKVRSLKKVIEIDLIKAKNILRQGQMTFDLQNAINLQAVTAVIKSNKFTVKSGGGGTFLLNSTGELKLAAADVGRVMSEEDKCLASLPALRIGGEVVDFELTSENGVTIGFSPKIDFDIGFGAEYRVKNSRMTSVFTASDPSRKRILHSVTTKEEQKEQSAAFKIDFLEMARLGFDYYSKTPLARVVEKSLDKAVVDIAKATAGLEWDAPVMIAERSLVAINAGFDVGIKPGDQFKVQNMTHYWQGAACQSAYLGSRPDPILSAIVEVYDVQAAMSWARVIHWNNSDSVIMPGARVRIEKLIADPVAVKATAQR